MAKADFLTGLVLLALGVYLTVEGLRMPGAGGFIEAGGEPGRVPVMLGAIITVLAAVLVVRSVRAGGHRWMLDPGPGNSDRRIGAMRCAVAAALCSGYAVGLLGAEIAGFRVPYPLATFLFLAAFIAVFEWPAAAENGARRAAWARRRAPALIPAIDAIAVRLPDGWGARVWLLACAIAQAVAVSWVVTYLFETQFYVKLP